MRSDAAMALGEIGDARAVEPLCAALKNSDKVVRMSAAAALVKIGVPAVGPLCVALKDSDKVVRMSAAAALGKIGNKRAVEPLCVALKDSDKVMRMSAAAALIEIGATEALVKIGAPAVTPLCAALKDSNKFVRSDAAMALGEIGDARAVEPLCAALKNSDKVVRMSAAAALVKIGAPAVTPLLHMYEHSDSGVRHGAAEALIQLGYDLLPPAWPSRSRVAHFGGNIVGVKNPHEHKVRVGLRSGGGDEDFTVDAHSAGTVNVPDGFYDIYFQYFSDPLVVYQGDSFSLSGNSVQITLERVAGGNFHVRKVN